MEYSEVCANRWGISVIVCLLYASITPSYGTDMSSLASQGVNQQIWRGHVNGLNNQDANQDGPPLDPVPLTADRVIEPKVMPVARSRYGNMVSYLIEGKPFYVQNAPKGMTQEGLASWYGRKFHGRNTSSMEPFDMYAMTAAHRTWPIPCFARVTNLENGRSAIVRVNDRGPFVAEDQRVMDLSYAAAVKLGTLTHGKARVRIELVEPASDTPSMVAVARTQPGLMYQAPQPRPIRMENPGVSFIQ